jgi:UDP-GlcNAc:undecaprenyl-phosphate/decaprenyl-phosphate GlcNAc-1-phosphate transferase
MRTLLLSAGSAFAVSALLVPVCRVVASRLGYVCKPRHDRWHRRATPLFGGVAIATAVLALAAVHVDLQRFWVLAVGGAAIFIVGFTDDLISLKPYTKLVAQIALASMFVFFGYRLLWTDSLTVDALLTIVWIVGLTNAFNLLDNMDGLCAGVALIAGSTLLVTLVLRLGVTPEAQYLALLLGATAGFLVYNVHPASIFMGDAGSLFIGLNFAVLTLAIPAGGYGPSNVLSIIAGPVLILLVPIFDTALVTISRLRSGRSAAQGGRDHSSHRLVAIGLSERAAVSVLWTLAALGGLLAVAVRGYNDEWSSVVAAIFILSMVIFAVYLAQVRVYEDLPHEIQSGRMTAFGLEVMYKRRVAEVLLDLCLVSISYYAAYRLRYEGGEWSTAFPRFLSSLPIILGVQMVALVVAGAYRGVWRHFGLMDGVVLARAVAVGTVASVGVIVYAYRFASYSRAVFVIYAALLMLMLTGSRASFRLISEFIRRRRHAGNRLVIYGAGDGGSMAIRELLNTAAGDFRMLGFIDDDPRKTRSRLQGYPVLGGYPVLESLIKSGAVDSVVLSTHLIRVAQLERLRDLCREHDVVLSRLHVELHELIAVS